MEQVEMDQHSNPSIRGLRSIDADDRVHRIIMAEGASDGSVALVDVPDASSSEAEETWVVFMTNVDRDKASHLMEQRALALAGDKNPQIGWLQQDYPMMLLMETKP